MLKHEYIPIWNIWGFPSWIQQHNWLRFIEIILDLICSIVLNGMRWRKLFSLLLRLRVNLFKLLPSVILAVGFIGALSWFLTCFSIFRFLSICLESALILSKAFGISLEWSQFFSSSVLLSVASIDFGVLHTWNRPHKDTMCFSFWMSQS